MAQHSGQPGAGFSFLQDFAAAIRHSEAIA
jgi:hypothetical protein